MKRSRGWAIGIVAGVIACGVAGVLLFDRFGAREPAPAEAPAKAPVEAAVKAPVEEVAPTAPDEAPSAGNDAVAAKAEVPPSAPSVRRSQPKPDWDISAKDWIVVRAATRNLGTLPLAGAPGVRGAFTAAALAAPAPKLAPRAGVDPLPKMIATALEALRAQQIATDATPILVFEGFRATADDGEAAITRVQALVPLQESARPGPPLKSLRLPETRVIASEPVTFNDAGKALTALMGLVRDQGLVLAQPGEFGFRFEDVPQPGEKELWGRVFLRIQ